MLRGSYGKEIDIWSAGVILYILLSGVPPFSAGTEEGIYDAIKQGGINFDTQPWPTISTSAKDLVRKMLSRDPNKWITSDRVLNHQWIKEGGEASHYPIDIAVFTKMKQSGEKHKLKKLAQKVIAENLSFEEIQGLKELFKRMDKDNSDTITYGELKTGLKLNAQKLPHVEVQRLMDDSCVGGNGTIDYLGFIDATMHRRKLHVEECIFKALHHFDKDNSGFIARDKLEKAMKKGGLVLDDDITMQEIISKVGTDNDGKINCEEIVALMKMRYPTPFHTIPDPYF